MKFAKKYVFCAKISTRSFLSFSSCFVFSLKWVWINPHLILLTLQFISFNIQFSCTCRHNFCTLLLPFFSTIILWMNWKHDMWISSRALFPLNEKRICRVNLARRKKNNYSSLKYYNECPTFCTSRVDVFK